MKKDKVSIILAIFLLIGISLLLYPSISDFWNASRSTRVSNEYDEEVANLSHKKIQDILEDARAYNDRLLNRSYPTTMTEEELADYYEQLSLENSQVMANVEIPSVNISLPIYHGTSDNILQSAVGHIEWTSLPVGGLGTHSTITGHRGLLSARLFTDIDQMVEGDVFYIYVLGEKLTYLVDQIKIVLPHEINELLIDPNEDYVTLLTCTPYGINTHRLLVRGHRIENEEAELYLISEATPVKPVYVALVLMVPLSIAVIILLLYFDKRRLRKEQAKREIK